MLRIVIYNSIQEDIILINETIRDILFKAKCNFELSTYLTSEKVIEKIKEDKYYYDILILDANNDNSYIISRKVRDINLISSIIFTTNIEIQVTKLLRYRPTALITDLKDSKNIFESFKYAYIEQKSIDSTFTIKNKDKIVKVSYRDIDYFENYQRLVTLHNYIRREKVDFYAKFDDVYNLLPKEIFLKCHQSYIVNLSHVKALDKTNHQFVLHSGQLIDISKRCFADVIEAFENYKELSY